MDGQPRPLHRSPPMRMSIFCQGTYYPAATAATSGASFTLGAHESGMHDAREHVPKLRGNFARDFLRLIVSTEQTTKYSARARRSSAGRCLYLHLIIILERAMSSSSGCRQLHRGLGRISCDESFVNFSTPQGVLVLALVSDTVNSGDGDRKLLLNLASHAEVLLATAKRDAEL